ncbi:MAG: hypothetical protein ACYCOO_02010 [Chitinophagaceae bacterium]
MKKSETEEYFKLSPALEEKISQFLEYHPPQRISRNLRRILLDYLHQELQVGVPDDIENMLGDLYALFEVLDEAEEETKYWEKQHED